MVNVSVKSAKTMMKNAAHAIQQISNRTFLSAIGAATALWILMYGIPSVLVAVFNNPLGIGILVATSYFLVFRSKTREMRLIGAGLIAISIILFQVMHLSSVRPGENSAKKEGFLSDIQFGLPQNVMDFLKLQQTMNRQTVFDTNILQQQTTPEEIDYFNMHHRWQWSPETIEKYKAAIARNPYIRMSGEYAVDYAQTIYNDQAIQQALQYQRMAAADTTA